MDGVRRLLTPGPLRLLALGPLRLLAPGPLRLLAPGPLRLLALGPLRRYAPGPFRPLALGLLPLLLGAASCGGGDAPPVRAPVSASASAAAWLPSGPERSASVWAVGDGADGRRAARRVARLIAAGRPDRVLYLGDVYGPDGLEGALSTDGDAEDFRVRFAGVYGSLVPRMAPTPGNHEWGRRGEGYEPFWRRATGRMPPAWYAFDVAGWRVLSLNSEAPHDARSPQLRWLRRVLARTPGTCTLAFWHRPRFGTGRHGPQPDVQPFWDALRGHARLVVNAHDHNLQRLAPIGGITQLVAGAGGRSHHALSSDPRRRFGDDTSDGALRLRLRRGRADGAFVAVGGNVLDRFSRTCRTS